MTRWFKRPRPARGSLGIAAVVVASVLSGCSGVGMLNALSPTTTHVLTTGVAYGPLPRQQLDIYTPAAAAPAGGWPVVVFFYGGAWNSGQRADYRFVGAALAAQGVLTLVADYRLYPEVRYPDFLFDGALALAYGLERAASLGGDPRRVFVMGHSAGGYNAAMLALDERWLKAAHHAPRELAGWIGLAGPYDFLPTENRDAQPVFMHPNYPPRAQPIEFVARDAPRSFIAAPTYDTVVSPQRSTLQLASKLQTAGAPVTVKLYGTVGHATLIGAFAAPLRWMAPVLADVKAFIDAAPAAASEGR
jgi:acetyl esterase/lipase